MSARTKLAWYAFACLSFLLTAIAAREYGETVLATDKTYISVAIVALYAVMTAWIGIAIHRHRPAPVYWASYVVTILPAAGIVGTLIGIAVLFGLSGGNDEAATLAGLGTALYTTLTGVIYAECLRFQLKIVARHD